MSTSELSNYLFMAVRELLCDTCHSVSCAGRELGKMVDGCNLPCLWISQLHNIEESGFSIMEHFPQSYEFPSDAHDAFISLKTTSSKRQRTANGFSYGEINKIVSNYGLINACRNRASLRVVQELYTACPDEFIHGNSSALHIALRFSAPTDVIKYLIDVAFFHRASLTCRNKSSCLTIQNRSETIDNHTKRKIVDDFYDAGQQAESERQIAEDGADVSPLSLIIDLITSGCHSNALEVLAHYLQVFPNVWKSANVINPLLRLLASRISSPEVFKAAEMLVTADASLIEARTPFFGSNALHLALLLKDCPCTLVELILAETNLNLMGMKNSYGDLPIHIAIAEGVAIDVLKLVVQKTVLYSPELMLEIDGRGLSLIHLAWVKHVDLAFCSRTRRLRKAHVLGEMLEDSIMKVIEILKSLPVVEHEADRLLKSEFGDFWEITELLLRYAPQGNSIGIEGGKSWRIVHSVASLNCPKGLMTLALALHPEQVREFDVRGQLPLHLASSSIQFSQPQKRYVLEKLLSIHPDAASAVDQCSMLPLHYAIESEKLYGGEAWSEAIIKIARANPDAMEVHHPNTRLYPFMQAAVEKSEINTIYELLIMAPHLVATGITP